MKIKRLEIQGFKSFADKVVLDFQQGVTGVVGPNGCGKSNIVDAIRWCMGEQSAKNLRLQQGKVPLKVRSCLTEFGNGGKTN